MTAAQAEQILTGLCAPFTKRLTEEERLVWLAELATMDAQQAGPVAVSYGKSGERFPSLPDFRRAVRGYKEREEPKHDLHGTVPRSKPPLWVYRWVAARFLYARFGRERDDRRFAEQGEWVDPTIPLMPGDEWLAEAAKISEADVWAAIPQAVKPV